MRRGLALGMLVLAACSGRGTGDGPAGAAVEAAGAKPVLDYPIDFATREKVPPVAGSARLAPHGDGYLATWIESGSLGQERVEASFLGADGAPLQPSPFSVGSGQSLLDAACSPAGDCLVLRDAGGLVGFEVTPITEAGAGKPFRIANARFDGRVAYDPAAAAFVVIWYGERLFARHFRDGAPLEVPLELATDSATLEALACSSADGCLATFWNGEAPGAVDGTIITATGAAPPFEIGASRLASLTWGGGVYLAVGPGGEGLMFSRLGVDGTALDPAPQPLTSLEPQSVITGAAFDGEAFTLLAVQPGSTIASGARVLPDGTPATPAAFDLDGLGLPFALACGDNGCAAAMDFDPDHESGLSAVPITHGAPGTPRAIGHELGGQLLDAAFSFGDKAFVAWNENGVVRARWFANDATAASPIIEVGNARFVEVGTADQEGGLLVAFHEDGYRTTRVVSTAGAGPERRIESPAITVTDHARFAWVDDAALDGRLTLRRFDADGRALDAHPIPIIGKQPDGLASGAVARSGDLFVVVTESEKPQELAVTRVRDTGEIIDQTTLPHAFFSGFACSPTECLIGEQGRSSLQPTDPSDVGLVRFASHADTLSFDISTLDTGTPEQVAWDGARFLVSYLRDDQLRLARLDDHGPVIGARLQEGELPSFLTPLANGRALFFSQVIRGSAKHPVELADVSLVLVDGFPDNPPPPPEDMGGDGVVAEGGACAVGSLGAASSNGEASAVAALLVAAAALRLRGRCRVAPRRRG